ncbi:MAG: nucleoside-triphosphatase, partial [Candidatus Micrarchaeota archaeon]
MPQNFFVIGEPKAGKTTLLKEVIAELKKKGLKVGGFISPEERHHGTRTAFYVMDVDTGKKAELANVKGDGPKVSKYHVNVKSFEGIALPCMEKADSYDVFVIDEIGIMELKSAKFADKLDELIDSHVPLVAALHKDFVKWYGPAGELMELSVSSRQAVATRLLRKAKESFGKREKTAPKKPAVKKPAKAEAKPAKKPEK